MNIRKHKALFRYLVAGGASYAIELALLLSLIYVFSVNTIVAVSISFWFGIFISFTLQKFLGFKNYEKKITAVSRQFIFYGLLVLFNYLFTLAITSLAPDKFILLSRTIALIIITFWNFVAYKIIFKQNPEVKNSKNFSINKKALLFVVVVTLIISLFFWKYLFTGSKIQNGDFDYYAQMYEAFRLEVLKYHQFPSWNPWMSGGMPLFTNPQFGLFSLQSILVLVFGTIPGIKIAYALYGMAGFWGMFILTKKQFKSSTLRSTLVGFLWVFGGFFYSHDISHFTFSIFYLFPWLVYFLFRWKEKYSWLFLGLLFSTIVLSSFHYGFLMMSAAICIVAFFYIIVFFTHKGRDHFLKNFKHFLIFSAKTAGIFLVLSGYRVITTYIFVANNEKPVTILTDTPIGLSTMLKSLFLPIGTILEIPKGLQWGWVEYSAYLGIGVTLVFFVIIIRLLKDRKISIPAKVKPYAFVVLLACLCALLLSLGDFNKFSPFNVLTHVPGFTQTRVASRWLIFVNFGLLVIIAGWKSEKKLINILLIISAIELFIFYGPIKNSGSNLVKLPARPTSSEVVRQYETENNERLKSATNLEYSYYFSTVQNIGQVYADDSLINTLNYVSPTNKCGENINPKCDLVLSDNAEVLSWTPNFIILERTSSGPIQLNINSDRGWRINNRYLINGTEKLRTDMFLTIPAGEKEIIRLTYSPKLSPDWIVWKIKSIF